MLNENELNILKRKYAKLIVNRGLKLVKGDLVNIEADTDQIDFINMVEEEAFLSGASDVTVTYINREFLNTRYKYADKNILSELPLYRKEELKYFNDKRVKRIYLESEDPNWLDSSNLEKYDLACLAYRKEKIKYWEDKSKYVPFTIVMVPGLKSSKTLFPNLSQTEAINKLWEYIFLCCHISLDEDVLSSWDKHVNNLENKAQYLTSLGIKELHYKASNGTDFTIGLIKNSHFAGPADFDPETKRNFYSNIPTEECFISPNKNTANGIVYNAKPLSHNGITIDKFYIKFKDGRIVEYKAEINHDALKSIIEADEGSHYIGEVALVPYSSPINQTGIIFQSILYDENASCHLAIGQAYEYCLNDYLNYSEDEIKKFGFNYSLVHVDFMIGTKDLTIEATTYDNKKIILFKDGEYNI